jgi:predicted lysophospholipase L1 biosynthesis ABC-type transport system permease subunit
MRIVGQAVFPTFGRGSFIPTGLGDGAIVTAAVLAPETKLAPGRMINFVLIRFAAGREATAVAADIRTALNASDCPPGLCLVRTARPPRGIATYGRIRGTPLVLAGLLAALSLLMLAHTLVTSVRQRRRDLALLKTLGFLRRQVSASVAWQASTLAAIGLLVGVPVGFITGRWAWSLFASQLGVPPTPVLPVAIVLLAIPATLLLANVIAAIPARAAGRTRPAIALRSE